MDKLIIVLVGPSGSGKTVLAKCLCEKGFYKPITCTTRTKRDLEKHEVDYFFLTEKEFLDKKQNNELIDYDRAFDTWYGLEKSQMKNSKIVFPATFSGYTNLKKQFNSKVISIFLDPPNEKYLKQRMIDRGMQEELINFRISNLQNEMQYKAKCDYIVSTDQEIQRSMKEIERIINDYK